MDIHLCNFSPAYAGNEINGYIHGVNSHPSFKELFTHFIFFFFSSEGGEGREGKNTLAVLLEE